jgi:hypothetical protein
LNLDHGCDGPGPFRADGSRPGPVLLDGIYLLREMQSVYDFEQEEFSLWVAPEIGKMLP